MKIVDHCGNSLVKGRLLRWQPKDTPDLYVKVIDVVPPTKGTPGRVEFVVTFGIQPTDREQGAIQFKDFVTVYDPEDELRAEAAMAEALKRLPGPVAVPDVKAEDLPPAVEMPGPEGAR